MYGDARGGNDSLTSSTGHQNSFYGDAFSMFDGAVGGNDQIGGQGLRNDFSGDAAEMAGHARGGNDTLTGAFDSELNDLTGDAQTMSNNARGGNDTLTGGAGGISNNGFNHIFGDARSMSGNCQGGNDTLIAGDNRPNIAPSTFSNLLCGDAVFISDSVRCGNDRLISGTGDDDMWGDAGAINGVVASPTTPTGNVKTGKDTFVFGPDNGNDLIDDFRQSDHDRIDVRAYGFHSIADMTLTAVGGNTKIAFDANNSVTLVGIGDPGILRGSDFIFA
jgi:hypothetical protein